MKVKKLLRKLRCPDCRQGSLESLSTESILYCTLCGARFPVLEDRPVLFRLQDLPVFLEENEKRKGSTEIKQTSWAFYHWHVYGFSNLLPPSDKGNELLVLGCGDGSDRGLIESKGFEVTGVDILLSPGTDVLCDGHNLPFQSESFDIVLSSQVLEHLHSPWLSVEEIARVLRSGGVFIGSVAFLKPCHQSFFHMTHLGLQSLLATTGLHVDHIHGAQSVLWSVLSEMLPFRLPQVARCLCEAIEGGYWRLRSGIRTLYNPVVARVDAVSRDAPVSAGQIHRLRLAPAIVFRAYKTKRF